MIKKAIEYFRHENPSIVKFSDGKYGIRKKERLTSSYIFLDIMDFTDTNQSEVTWRVSINLDSIYSWCTHSDFDIVHKVHKKLCEKQKKSVISSRLSEEEINKLVFCEKLKG